MNHSEGPCRPGLIPSDPEWFRQVPGVRALGSRKPRCGQPGVTKDRLSPLPHSRGVRVRARCRAQGILIELFLAAKHSNPKCVETEMIKNKPWVLKTE